MPSRHASYKLASMGIGVGIDLLHLPRLNRVLFPPTPNPHYDPDPNANCPSPSSAPPGIGSPADKPGGDRSRSGIHSIERLERIPALERFARRILTAEEAWEFKRRFYLDSGGSWWREPQVHWKERVKRWLGVRWVVKEALYKAYPYPLTQDVRPGGSRKESAAVHDSGITWKEVCLKYHSRSGGFSIFFFVSLFNRALKGLIGKPYLLVSRLRSWGAQSQLGRPTIYDKVPVSISHDGEYIVAVVLYPHHTVDQPEAENPAADQQFPQVQSQPVSPPAWPWPLAPQPRQLDFQMPQMGEETLQQELVLNRLWEQLKFKRATEGKMPDRDRPDRGRLWGEDFWGRLDLKPPSSHREPSEGPRPKRADKKENED